VNTIIKLDQKLQQLGVSLSAQRSGNQTWIAHLYTSSRAIHGEANSLDLAIDRAVKRWAAHDDDERQAPTPPLPEQAKAQSHPDLPGHEHCGQPYCTLCRAPYDHRGDNGVWLTCTLKVCPSCVADAEESARGQKHPKQYFLDQDYPVTIYEEPDDGFAAECRDLPGATAFGKSVEEAYREAKTAARAWIDTAVAMGDRIPLPTPCPED
jgi:predicted RNase H-like HicB family nuclease